MPVGYITTVGVGIFEYPLRQNMVATSYETELDLFKAIPDLCEHAVDEMNRKNAGGEQFKIFSIDVKRISRHNEKIHYEATIKVHDPETSEIYNELVNK